MKHIVRAIPAIVVAASLAMMAPADQVHKHRAKKHKELALAAPPAAELVPMIGTWSLRSGDKPRTDIKMVFRPNGTFAFIGPNWNSKGNFRIAEHKLCLEWTSVDGSAVKPGTVKKDFPMADDEASFTIDTYTYFKLHN